MTDNDDKIVQALKSAVESIVSIWRTKNHVDVHGIKPAYFEKMEKEIEVAYNKRIDELIKFYELEKKTKVLKNQKAAYAKNKTIWRPSRNPETDFLSYVFENNMKKKQILLKLIREEDENEELHKKRYNDVFQDTKKNFKVIVDFKKKQHSKLVEQAHCLHDHVHLIYAKSVYN